MKKFSLFFILVIGLRLVSAQVLITEVMYDPVLASDTDLEWIEIYNNGSGNIDLSSWKIDGNNFDDFSIMPGEFTVIARELIDGTDLDNDSFESIYGNNDGIWNNLDGNYRAFSGTFSFTDNDIINISNGTYSEILIYNSSFGGNGNGYTIEKINVNKGNEPGNWRESLVLNGTHGYGFVEKENTRVIGVAVEVSASAPDLSLINISDDLAVEGIQIMPSIGKNKSIFLDVFVNSTLNINYVKAELNGNEFYLENESVNIFNGTLLMNYFDKPGNYTINISAGDEFNLSSSFIVNFEYLEMIAISLSNAFVDFGKLNPGELSKTNFSLANNGNADVDIEAFGTDLEGSNYKIGIDNIEIGENNSLKTLGYIPKTFDINLLSGINSNKDIALRLNIPTGTRPSTYLGNINIIGVKS